MYVYVAHLPKVLLCAAVAVVQLNGSALLDTLNWAVSGVESVQGRFLQVRSPPPEGSLWCPMGVLASTLKSSCRYILDRSIYTLAPLSTCRIQDS